MGYEFVRNGCHDRCQRYKWAKLGRGQGRASFGIDEKGRLFAWGQNSNFQTGLGYTAGSDAMVEIELATQVGGANNWIKADAGEVSSMALNGIGELFGSGYSNPNCASFGLAINSGDDGAQSFYTMQKVNDDYYWIDFIHDYYCTLAVAKGGQLYGFGEDLNGALGQGDWLGSTYQTPTIVTGMDSVLFLDGEYEAKACVLENYKVYVWSTFGIYAGFNYNTPTEITGLPGSAVIIDMSCSGDGVVVVLDDGSVWFAGEGFLFGDGLVTYPAGSATFQEVTTLSAKNIVKVELRSDFGGVMEVLDDNGNIWGVGYTGENNWAGTTTSTDPQLTWVLVAAEFEGQRKFIDMSPNPYQYCAMAIDIDGYLWTWGYQVSGPHLAIGAAVSQIHADYDPNVTDIVYVRNEAGYASDAVLSNGEPALLNVWPTGDSPFIGGS